MPCLHLDPNTFFKKSKNQNKTLETNTQAQNTLYKCHMSCVAELSAYWNLLTDLTSNILDITL